MQDEKTPYLNLPLPHEDNLLEDDVLRIQETILGIDQYAQNADAQNANALSELNNSITTALANRDASTAASLGLKADKTDVTASLALKADKTDMTAELALKANLQKLLDHIAETSHTPKGIVVMWSGAANAIPAGWALCNGQNGTPNLQDRFIVGAGSGYGVGAQGGVTSHGHGASADNRQPGVYTDNRQPGVYVGNTTLAEWQMPHHAHSYMTFGYHWGDDGGWNRQNAGEQYPGTGGTGGSGAHNHGAWQDTHNHGAWQDAHNHGIGVNAAENRPPYYALCFIMKV